MKLSKEDATLFLSILAFVAVIAHIVAPFIAPYFIPKEDKCPFDEGFQDSYLDCSPVPAPDSFCFTTTPDGFPIEVWQDGKRAQRCEP